MSTLLFRKSVEVTDHAATGAAMRAKRKRAKLSLRVVAARMGVSTQFVCDLELGRKNWSEERAVQFAQALRLRQAS